MSIICLIFGHKLPSQAQVVASITYPDFQCRECKRMIDWNTMPRKVQAMRAEYLRRRAR